MRVLIADDAPFIREIVRSILQKHGFLICGEAVDGDDAIDQALEQRPDLILMDIIMPRKSGLEAARAIVEKWPAAQIIALTTADQDIMISRAIEVGCKGFVAKPFQPQDLLGAIRGLQVRAETGAPTS